MNGATTRVALGAVAVVAVALGGLYLVNRSPDSGVSGPSASPSTTPSPSTISYDSHAPGALEPGTYVMEHVDPKAGFRITFTLPAGWEKLATAGVIFGPDTTIGLAVHDNLYVDPCANPLATHNPPVGPTVDDLVAALDTTVNLDARATDVTMSGFAGKQVDLVALEPWAPCAAGEPQLFPRGAAVNDWPAPDPGDHGQLRILDVGGARLVMGADWTAARTNRPDLQAIFDSIRIELTSSTPASAVPSVGPNANPS